MKNVFFVIIILTSSTNLFSQMQMASAKPIVDTGSFFNWPSVVDWVGTSISNDGRFVLYKVENVPAGEKSLILQSSDGQDKFVLRRVKNAVFTNDSHFAVFLNTGDSLCLYGLTDHSRTYVSDVGFFTFFTRENDEYLAYIKRNPERKLIIRNINTAAQDIYSGVDRFDVSESGNTLILRSLPDPKGDVSIRWVDLLTKGSREVWKGKNPSHFTLDSSGSQLAFLVTDSAGINKVCLYRNGQDKSTTDSFDSLRLQQNLHVDAIENFSKDGSKLFVRVRQNDKREKNKNLVPVNIWSNTDRKLQSEQLLLVRNGLPACLAVFDIAARTFRQLQLEDEFIEAQSDNSTVVSFRQSNWEEHYWNKKGIATTALIDIETGKKSIIPITRPTFSPHHKFLIGYGREENLWDDLYVYDMATGACRNITGMLPIPEQGHNLKIVTGSQQRNIRLAGWLPNDSAVLAYDNYDIWQLDPSGVLPPVNLTNGRKDKWQFRLNSHDIIDGIVSTSASLVLSAFNKATKKGGFYKLSIDKEKTLECLYVGDYYFQEFSSTNGSPHFLKSRDADVYVVKRERADESPNLFSTSDFRSFTSLSNIKPEKSFNWLTTELINFKTEDRISSQAVLYKPENFDRSKKYPMIIQFYQDKSDELNWYTRPLVDNGGELDVPWFVSRGYLVLKPDIKYKVGEPGASALKSVEAAANVMTRRPYVDKQRIGIQGHSFGGYETNYIVTHSKMFAAAMSGAGVCNLVSDFGNVWPGENSRQEYWETRDGSIGNTPWERPDLYVSNSPVFSIGNVRAPILMLHNRNDKNVHFEEGLQFFTGLRRAGKRAWMLEYDNGGHGVWGEDYKDFLIRQTQFFDHYLKGAPAPRWMMYGIPAKDKGYDDGMELVMEKDADGNWVTPPEGGLLRDELKGNKAELSGKNVW